MTPAQRLSQRSEAMVRSTGEPCRRYASIGYRRCKLHGGERGSGRPTIHGKRSALGQRDAQFLRLVTALLNKYYDVPEPVDV